MERKDRAALSLYGRDGRRKCLTPSERSAFILAARNCPRAEVRTLCLFLAYAGCRISEALGVTAASIERTEAFASILSLKKRGMIVVRELPLPEELIRQIDFVHGLAAMPPGERLWPWSRGRAWFLVKQVMIEAGIKDGPHRTAKGLRHSFGIHAVRSRVPVTLVQRWLGHARLETTAIYLNAIGDEERELAARMWTDLPATWGHTS